MTSIGSRLEANSGVGPGFDALRVGLAFAVVAWHCVPMISGSQDQAIDTPGWVIVYALLPLFFALSGFLVTASALRLDLLIFFASRALRILPALAVDTLFTVLILGPFVTSLSLSAYFAHPETWRYLLNIIGEIHFTLPGVFKNNPLPDFVNGSLWTIPPELACYLALCLLIVTGMVRRTGVVVGSAVALFVGIAAASLLPEGTFPFQDMMTTPSARLVGFFLLGSACYLLRGRIPYSAPLFLVSVAVLPVGAILGTPEWVRAPLWVLGTALPLTYAMAYLGLTRLPVPPIVDRGDYSYGIYLYGYPIQQTIVHFVRPDSAPLLFVMSIVPVMLLAMFSWHLVEKPTLRLRKFIRRPVPPVATAPATA